MPLAKSLILISLWLIVNTSGNLTQGFSQEGKTATAIHPKIIDSENALEKNTETGMSTADVIHDQLRALREDFIQAINNKDYEAIVGLLHPEVILTAQEGKNLSLIRRQDGVRRYLDRLLVAPGHGVESMRITPRVDDLSVLYNDDTAVAFGSSQDHYRLVNGNEFDLKTRWSVTAVKEGDKWLLANIHVSTNLFDNPVLATLSRMALWLALGSFFVGMAVGYFALRMRSRPAEQKVS